MENTEILTNIGILIGGILAALITYHKSKGAAGAPRHAGTITDIVGAGVGIELGNRHQTEQIIEQLTRIGDIMENKQQQGLEDMLREIRDRLEVPPPRSPRRRRTSDAKSPPRG